MQSKELCLILIIIILVLNLIFLLKPNSSSKERYINQCFTESQKKNLASCCTTNNCPDKPPHLQKKYCDKNKTLAKKILDIFYRILPKSMRGETKYEKADIPYDKRTYLPNLPKRGATESIEDYRKRMTQIYRDMAKKTDEEVGRDGPLSNRKLSNFNRITDKDTTIKVDDTEGRDIQAKVNARTNFVDGTAVVNKNEEKGSRKKFREKWGDGTLIP